MRRHLIRFLVVLLTFALGTTLAMLWRLTKSRLAPPSAEQPQASGKFDLSLPVELLDYSDDGFGSCGREPFVVISVPNDNEIYIGKEKVTLSEIPYNLIYKVNGRFPSKVVYIKARDFVKFRTLVSIVNQIRETGSIRIGLRRDTKRVTKNSSNN